MRFILFLTAALVFSPLPSTAQNSPQATQAAAEIQGESVNPESFIGSQTLFQQVFWSDPRSVLYGKSVTRWSNADFLIMEKKLKQQISLDYAASANGYGRPDLKYIPESDRIFMARKRDLDRALSSIPQFQQWAESSKYSKTNMDLQADESRMQKGETQQDIEVAKLVAEEKRKAEAERQRILLEAKQQADRIAAEAQMVEKAQLEKAKSEATRLFGLIVLGLVLVIGAVGYRVWDKFIRRRCPQCQSKNVLARGVKELDRWKGKTRVQEKNSRGTNTRYISVTKVENQYFYACSDCGHVWSVKVEEERG